MKLGMLKSGVVPGLVDRLCDGPVTPLRSEINGAVEDNPFAAVTGAGSGDGITEGCRERFDEFHNRLGAACRCNTF